ncbi:MAG TPA: DUF4011 domain-containing protein [Solirubrobacterales bacterium]|jgi:hypothetical protein
MSEGQGGVTASAEITGSVSGRLGVVLALDLRRLGVVTVDETGVVEDPSWDGAPAAMAEGDERSATPVKEEAPTALEEKMSTLGRERIEKAVERWKSDLIDLTARNRLLYFRDLQTGSLSLDEANRDLLMRLIAGQGVALSKLVPRSLPPSSPLAKLTPFEDAVRRTRAITRTARSYEEERGIKTLFLACGLATWKSDRASRPPAAPVLLVPLDVRARGASQQDFELSIVGDLEVNPTLLHMLRVEHGIEVDEAELFEHAEVDGVIDTPEEMRLAFNWLGGRCANLPGWAIGERFILGNFWYAKLPMVRDLETSVDVIGSHDIAAAMAGDIDARGQVLAQRKATTKAREDVDELPPASEFNVLDSDSSQSLAIARVLAGENLVLKGPPGTGKSQTIANLICSAIGEEKRVLFVAEKRAAIEAVTRRLEAVGLEDLVLDMHQGAESRKWLAAQLGVSLDTTATVAAPDQSASHSHLARTRETLRDHARELHREHEPWGISIFAAQARLLELGQPEVTTRLRGKDLERLSEERYAELLDALRDMISLDGLSLGARGSPWADAQVSSQEEVAEALALLEALASSVPKVEEELVSAAEGSGLPRPEDLAAAEALVELWGQVEDRASLFTPAIFDAELGTLLESVRPLEGSAIQRFLATVGSSEYRSALRVVREGLVEGVELEPGSLFAELSAAAALQDAWRAVCVADRAPSAPANTAALRQSLATIRADLEALGKIVGRELTAARLVETVAAVEALRAEGSTLAALPRVHRARHAFAEAGLTAFVSELEADQGLIATAELELDRLRWQSIVDQLMLSPTLAPTLAAFRGERHEQSIAAFRELDREHMRTSAQRVRRIAAEVAVRAQDRHPEEAQLVRAQAKRKRGHLPVRQLFSRAPNVVTALRPCWVMSPLMVSQAIPSDKANFDIVVFDEASQVRPVDALSSLIRGRQLVVAGDEHQLPPTSFFDQAPASNGADEETDEGEASEVGDYESLLDVLMTLFDAEMLLWHYRSRDERLIGFSNQEIYGGSLTTFPGIVDGQVLRHVLVSDLPAEGELRVSPDAEVKQVIELVLEHARTRPEESLGVITLGIAHAEAIDAGLLARLPEHPELEDFFSEDREERFFVKNLERVQGDERDAIILAVGYGRTPEGTLPHRFGPLNHAGGERRLNVAVTRAKHRMTVVSSFSADEIDPARSSALGVKLLKAFLGYASTGGSVDADESKGEGTIVHRMLAEALAAGGYETKSALGYSADRIDVAVIDPGTGQPAAALEIDGKTYAARPSVRDRDRLRAEQLERLGWKHLMVWSMDWYRDPAEAARRLVDRIAEQFDGMDSGGIAGDEGPSAGESGESSIATGRRERSPRPNFSSGGPLITDWRLQDLVALAAWIESDGLLRTSEELQREMMVELGIARRGARVARILDEVTALRRSTNA